MFAGRHNAKLNGFRELAVAGYKSFLLHIKHAALYAIPDIITENGNMREPGSIGLDGPH
jgi:hypothetical protein